VKFVLYSKPSKVKTSFWQTNHIGTVLSLVEAAKLRSKTADKTANFKLVLCTGDWIHCWSMMSLTPLTTRKSYFIVEYFGEFESCNPWIRGPEIVV
jgi:hypothetical protein